MGAPENIEPGLSPREAGAYLDRLRRQVRILEQASSDLFLAYDAELHRRYGYHFCRPLPDGRSSIEALRAARARWDEAVAGFVMPDIDSVRTEVDAEIAQESAESARRLDAEP